MIIRDAINKALKLIGESSPTPCLDCEILLAHVLKTNRKTIIVDYNRDVKTSEMENFLKLVEKRGNLVPVSYLTGRKFFFSHEFKVDKRVLTPRPETEHLVEAALSVIRDSPFSKTSVLDICTGSGCVGISLAAEADITLTLSDVSEDALSVADMNISSVIPEQKNKISCIKSNLFDKISGKFDIITSNPPYLSKKDMEETVCTPLVHEPQSALYGGFDGMDITKKLIKGAHGFLKKNGYLIVELGYAGSKNIRNIESPLEFVKFERDLGGTERVAMFRKNH